MKVTYNWLKDFVPINISPKLLAEKLTMAGLEVTSLEEKDSDFVFEIEVTSNRPDCLSIIGIAREVSAITGKKLFFHPSIPLLRFNSQTRKLVNPLTIKIQDKRDCPLYTAKVIKDVKVGPSPDWLKRRLELVGCRSVNNVVDITNYILFELGEPLHAFDLDKLIAPLTRLPALSLTIMVRRAKNAEEIVTIDGVKRTLKEDILVIASTAQTQAARPVAIAGIMGGRDTEVTEDTENIILEAAVFNPTTVRRARQALGLISESAYRFERGVDTEIVEKASRASVKLIQELTGGRCVLAKHSGLLRTQKKSISLNVATVNKVLGVNLAPLKIKKVLNALEFKVKTRAKNNFTVGVPSLRQDVNLEIDLVEEIARIFGYANIPNSLPAVKPQITIYEMRDQVSLIKNILLGLGLNEVITYSLIDKDFLKNFYPEEDCCTIEVLNPLSKEQAVLRPRLMPSLSRCIAYNLNQKQSYVNIFEIAKKFSTADGQHKEEFVLGIALCGRKSFLMQQGFMKDELGFLHLKGILMVIFERLGIKDYDFSVKNAYQIEVLLSKEKVGVMLRLRKEILDRLDIKNKDVFGLALSLEGLFSYAQLKKRFVPLPRYPGIVRDISFILKDKISIKEIFKVMEAKGKPLLSNIELIDYYKGKQIPPGYRGLTVSCLYLSQERTLTEAQVNPIHSSIIKLLVDKFDIKLR